MIDFNSFINAGDIITIDDESELEAILPELEEADILLGDVIMDTPITRRATISNVRSRARGFIKYIIFFRSLRGELYFKLGTSSPNFADVGRQYTVSEIFKFKVPELPDSDFEPLDESSLREFFGL